MSIPAEEILQKAYREEHGKLLNYVKTRIPDKEDAEDMVQEVFVQALVNLNALQGIENIAAWLFRVASNRIIDKYRRRKYRNVGVHENAGEIESFSLTGMFEHSGFDPGDPETFEFLAGKLNEWIEALPEGQRMVIRENIFKGKTFRKIAAESGISINTLLSRKRYAILALQEKVNVLQKQMNEGE